MNSLNLPIFSSEHQNKMTQFHPMLGKENFYSPWFSRKIHHFPINKFITSIYVKEYALRKKVERLVNVWSKRLANLFMYGARDLLLMLTDNTIIKWFTPFFVIKRCYKQIFIRLLHS